MQLPKHIIKKGRRSVTNSLGACRCTDSAKNSNKRKEEPRKVFEITNFSLHKAYCLNSVRGLMAVVAIPRLESKIRSYRILMGLDIPSRRRTVFIVITYINA